MQTMKTRNPDFKAAVEHIFTAANFINLLGIKLKEAKAGCCEAELELGPAHQQHLGRIHGGVLVTLAGHTATGAATSLIEAGKAVVALEFKINILRSITAERLLCRAQVLMSGSKALVAEAEVFDGPDATAKLGAKAMFTFMVVDA